MFLKASFRGKLSVNYRNAHTFPFCLVVLVLHILVELVLTLYNVCSVHRGVFSTLGGYHEDVGGYHEYIGGVRYIGDITMHVGDIMSTLGDTMSTSGDTSGDVQYIGDIMMHVREQVGKNLSISIENPNVLNIPQCSHEIPPMYSWYPSDVLMVSPLHASWYPPWCTEHPPMYLWYLPNVLMISPNVLMISLWCTHGIPQCTEHPPMYSWYPPYMHHDIPPDVLNIPQCTYDISPMYLWYPPNVLMVSPNVLMISPMYSWYPPMYWTPPPPDVLNTHYTGWYLLESKFLLCCSKSILWLLVEHSDGLFYFVKLRTTRIISSENKIRLTRPSLVLTYSRDNWLQYAILWFCKTVEAETLSKMILNSSHQKLKFGAKKKIQIKVQVSFDLLWENLTCSLSYKVISYSKEITGLRSFYRKYNIFFFCFFRKFLDHQHQPKLP